MPISLDFKVSQRGQMSGEKTDIRKALPGRLFNIVTGFPDDITWDFDFTGQASCYWDI